MNYKVQQQFFHLLLQMKHNTDTHTHIQKIPYKLSLLMDVIKAFYNL